MHPRAAPPRCRHLHRADPPLPHRHRAVRRCPELLPRYLTTFIFWLVTIATNLLRGIGAFSSADTTASLTSGLSERGHFAAGVVLAYVFVVPPKPYGLPIHDSMPASTVVFVIGLVTLVVSSF